jgi:hypothetical protein
MDALLQLIIPEIPTLPDLQRYQREFSWGGETYPQEPVTYRWGPKVELIESETQSFIVDLLPEDFISQDWKVLDVARETLDLIERDVNGEQVDWYGYNASDLLTLLLAHSDKWVLIFEPYYDQIDHVFRISAEECLDKLKFFLNRKNERKGFIAIPPSC